MEIQQNPFTSDTYNKVWQTHYNKDEKIFEFDAIKGVSFNKAKQNYLFVNVGTVKTLGINYSFNKNSNNDDIKGKVFLIYDVPSYNSINLTHQRLKTKKIKLHDGFRVDTKKYTNLEDYICKTLSNNRRKSFLKAWRKLEREHNISYKVFKGSIKEDTFKELFDSMYEMMELQYEEKSETNYHTNEKSKSWHYSLFFELINKNMASIQVIYNEQTPIAISFNYHAENIFFAPFGSYDNSYRKYSIGNIQMMKELEWVIEDEKCQYYDLGKVSYGYKQRWVNDIYSYEYHLIYDKKSLYANTLVWSIYVAFRTKSILKTIYYKIKHMRGRR